MSGDTFHVEEEIEIVNIPEYDRSVIRFGGKIVFDKFSFFKSIILSKTKDGFAYTYNAWLKEVTKRDLLPKLNAFKIEKPMKTIENAKPSIKHKQIILAKTNENQGDTNKLDGGISLQPTQRRVVCVVAAMIIILLVYMSIVEHQIMAIEKRISI